MFTPRLLTANIMSFISILTCVILVVFSITADKCFPPAQQGFPHTSNFTVENIKIGPYDGIQWLLQPVEFRSPVLLWKCFMETSQCTGQQVLAGINTGANISQYDSETHRSYFTIYNVTTYLNGYTIQWQTSTDLLQACELEVFDFNSTASCDKPYIENKASTNSPSIQVTVDCRISNIYPVPKCEFEAGKGQTTEHDATLSTGTPGYYDRQCTLSVPVTGLVPKEYGFHIFLYPDITNGKDYGKTSVAPPIDLSLPKPTCENPRLTANNNDVSITCRVTSVFTEFTCNFKEKTGALGDFEPVGHETQSTLLSCSNSPPISCDSQCTLTMSVSLLGVGIHRFTVSMTKDGYTTDSDSTNGFDLRYPVARIINCPNGEDDYIEQGITATCDCELQHPGNPPGKAQWVLPDNTEVGNATDDTTSSLSVTYDPQEQNPHVIYYCQGDTLLPGNKSKETFTPKFAYGPDNVKATILTPFIDLCPSNKESIEINCDVPIKGANPKPTVVVKSLGRVVAPINETQVSGDYRFHFSFIPRYGGILKTSCVAHNPIIPSMKIEVETFSTVLEPPSSQPSLFVDSLSTLQNRQKVNVTNGQLVEVQCKVQSGFPPVTEILMTCAGLQKQTMQTLVVQTITLNKTNNNDMCSCSAVHSSDCYDLSTTFTFNVQYSSELTNYTVQTPTQQVVVNAGASIDTSNSSRLEVNVGTPVTFVCEGEGNPEPEIKIKSQSSTTLFPSQLVPSGDFKTKAVVYKTMTCRDTAFYTCDAFNGIGTVSLGKILILVKCTPEMSETNTEPSTYSFMNGEDLEIEFKILGYPDPNEYTLTKIVRRIKRSTDNDGIEPQIYKVSFNRTDELYGEVILTMYDMTESEDGQYELKIQNGIGDGLVYSFYAAINKDEGRSSSDNIGAITGGSIAALGAAALIILIIIFLHRKSRPVKKGEEEMYENDKPGFKVSEKRKKETASSKNSKNDIPMSSIEDVDCPPNRTQYEEIDIPASGNIVASGDFHQAGHINQDQRQRPSEGYEHAYNLIHHNTYDTAGAPYERLDRRAEAYERIDPSASTSARKEAGYENVTQVSSASERKD